MALSGIAIYKHLPKKNCGECGVPTCLAFAMGLAAGKAELDACPYVSEEARNFLAEASAPPIATVTIGTGENAFRTGGETVLFRHEKTFFNPPGFTLLVKDTEEPKRVAEKLESFRNLQYERVGLTLKADLLALQEESGEKEKFLALVKEAKEKISAPLILMSEKPEFIAAALDVCGEDRPLLYAATQDNLDAMGELALTKKCPLAVKAETLDKVVEITARLSEKGIKELVIDSGATTTPRLLQDQVGIRRAALLNKDRRLGFPTIIFPGRTAGNPMEEALAAAVGVAKYAGIIVLSELNGETLFPLLLERLNIYTDPQRPMAVKEGIYEINNPDENAPLLVTTNFALTYFIVSGELESSRMPAWLLVQEAEGLSVLTAWAADKFVAQTIAPLVKKSGIVEKIKHQRLIIPGYTAQIAGELEEELPGWEIAIGPREASQLPAYLKK